MTIQNKEVQVNVLDSNHKKIASTTIHNRVLNNFFDFMLYKFTSNNSTNYPDLVGSIPTANPCSTVYIKFNTTQTITDTSTSMSYDVKATSIKESEVIDTNANNFEVTTYYEYEIPALYDGDQIYGLGFGQDEASVTDYLLSFVDVENLNVALLEGNILQIVRVDNYSGDGNFIEGSTDFGKYPFHLGYFDTQGVGNLEYFAQLYSISTSYDGTTKYKEYLESSLTQTVGVGKITYTGFDNFRYQSGDPLYPATDLFPSASLFPSQPDNQIRYMIYEYQIIQLNTSTLDTTVYDTYRMARGIKDLTSAEDNTTLAIDYTFERGEE